jgi:hypothetical protein
MRAKEIIRKPNFLFFFLGLFLYYFLVFDSSLYYHHHQPIFLFYKPYLKDFLLYPGGPAELITQFFLQFFYFNLLGALILAALSISVFILVYKLLKKIGNFKFSLILSFLPVCFLLIIQNRYNFPLVVTVKYLFALFFFLAYLKIPERYKVFFIALSCLIYYILGGWVYLFYIVLCVLHELFFRKDSRKYIYAGLNSLVYFIYPYIAARYLFMISLKDAYLYIVPLEATRWPFDFKLNLYFYLFFLSLPMLQTALFIYLKYIKDKIKNRNKSPSGKYYVLEQSIYILLLGALILTFSFARQEKKKIQVDYLAERGRWEELLNLTPEIEGYDLMVNFNVNRALYHTGQLLDNLFGYPQMFGADVLFLENVPRPVKISAIDIYFDLGHIRATQVLAYEGQTHFGYNPKMLKSVVKTNIIKEEYNIAEKFLNILNKSIMYKKWVRHYRDYLSNESLIKSDSLIQLKRKLAPKFDFFIAIGERSDMDLIELLKENEKNKMAFEYLMAYYLLEFRLEDLMAYLGKFKELGYEKYPRYIEEAILVSRFAYPSKKFKVDYSINQQTAELFERFNNILSSFRNKEEAQETLKRGFYHTYWYYSLYIKPGETNLE